MRRDKVIGLGLAVMLAGFAAAFCYRNDPFMEKGLNLARTKFLEQVIANRRPQTAASRETLQSEPLPERIVSKPPIVSGQQARIDRTEPPVSLNEIQQLDELRETSPIAETRPISREPIARTEPTRIDNPFETAEPPARPVDKLVSTDNDSRRSDPQPRMAANRPSPGYQLADRQPQRAQQIYVPASSRRVRGGQPAKEENDQAALPPDYPAVEPQQPTIVPNGVRRAESPKRDRPIIVPEGVRVEEPASATDGEIRVIPREIPPFQSQRLVPQPVSNNETEAQQYRRGGAQPVTPQPLKQQDVEELPAFQLDGTP